MGTWSFWALGRLTRSDPNPTSSAELGVGSKLCAVSRVGTGRTLMKEFTANADLYRKPKPETEPTPQDHICFLGKHTCMYACVYACMYVCMYVGM